AARDGTKDYTDLRVTAGLPRSVLGVVTAARRSARGRDAPRWAGRGGRKKKALLAARPGTPRLGGTVEDGPIRGQAVRHGHKRATSVAGRWWPACGMKPDHRTRRMGYSLKRT